MSCGTFGRLLKSPGSALDRNVTSLPLHNALTVELRLLKIDYWSYTSGDQFVVYVDDRVAYESGSSFYASASSNTRSECGNSDHEIELRASFVVEHDAATANIRVVAGETREFGLMSASIIASTIVAPSPAPTTFVQDAFIGGTVCDRRSWSGSMDCPHSCGNSMYHTTGTPELRVPNGGSLDKTIWNIPAHNVLILDFAFVKRGSWNGEEIRVHVDEEAVSVPVINLHQLDLERDDVMRLQIEKCASQLGTRASVIIPAQHPSEGATLGATVCSGPVHSVCAASIERFRCVH